MTPRKSLAQHILEFWPVHHGRYTYGTREPKNNRDKIDIFCRKHGLFQVGPNWHKLGQGCKECNIEERIANNARLFNEKANNIHDYRYNYSKVKYINAETKIIIICIIHGEFEQTPHIHLSGNGCAKCSGHLRLTTKQFIDRSNITHNNKYDYSKVKYINSKTKVIIICKEPGHGEFEQRASCHLDGAGCPTCAITRLNNEIFIERSNIIHSYIYDYSKVEYINNHKKVIIICNEPGHGEFEQIPSDHLYGHGCPKCAYDLLRLTPEEFSKRGTEIHKGIYTYELVKYINTKTPVIVTCTIHNSQFEVTPDLHLYRKQGCPECSNSRRYSLVSMEWLKSTELYFPTIQHALNVGEYHIENRRYQADGYVPETKTIYEFHGCYFHGCPTCFPDRDKEMFSGVTFQEKYDKTLEKKEYCKSLGYNYVEMWECQWIIIKKTIKNSKNTLLPEIENNNFEVPAGQVAENYKNILLATLDYIANL